MENYQATLNEDEAQLAVLENEISQAEASLENDFASFAKTKIEADEALEELFFEDKQAFIKKILTLQNEFLKTLQDKVNKANDLRGKIGQRKAFDNIQQAADAFDAKHDDITSEELLDFFKQDLSPRVKATIENLEPAQFFEELFKIYNSQKGATQETKTQNQDHIPQRLNASSSNADETSEPLLTQRF